MFEIVKILQVFLPNPYLQSPHIAEKQWRSRGLINQAPTEPRFIEKIRIGDGAIIKWGSDENIGEVK